ncbi:hypothetical protein ACIA5D_39280 [Actinoplanes sp. NPDC051513]|uniref:hypothetical protein n=1 Tax=Actinoplanes sp. NPDC051513 TaxID=3363908 RepID=UPI0037AC2EBA
MSATTIGGLVRAAANLDTDAVIAAGPGWDDATLPAITVSAALKATLARLSSGGEGADESGDREKETPASPRRRGSRRATHVG